MRPRKILGSASRTIRPAPKAMLTKAVQHEANFYRPFLDAGRIIGRRAQHIADGRKSSQPSTTPRPLHISRADGWRYALAAVAIVGFCSYLAAHGDLGALVLAPVALVPGTLAWAGLRRSKR